MAATTAGAIKSLVETLGLGLVCYRDAAPRLPGAGDTELPPMPFASVRERIAAAPDADGLFDLDVSHTERETVQVDLWQQWRDLATGKPTESYTLARALRDGLAGAQLTGLPWRVYGVRVSGSVRLLEPDDNVVHDAITVTLYREA